MKERIEKLKEDIEHIEAQLHQLRMMTSIERDSRYTRLNRQLRLRQTELAQLQDQEVLEVNEIHRDKDGTVIGVDGTRPDGKRVHHGVDK